MLSHVITCYHSFVIYLPFLFPCRNLYSQLWSVPVAWWRWWYPPSPPFQPPSRPLSPPRWRKTRKTRTPCSPKQATWRCLPRRKMRLFSLAEALRHRKIWEFWGCFEDVLRMKSNLFIKALWNWKVKHVETWHADCHMDSIWFYTSSPRLLQTGAIFSNSMRQVFLLDYLKRCLGPGVKVTQSNSKTLSN